MRESPILENGLYAIEYRAADSLASFLRNNIYETQLCQLDIGPVGDCLNEPDNLSH